MRSGIIQMNLSQTQTHAPTQKIRSRGDDELMMFEGWGSSDIISSKTMVGWLCGRVVTEDNTGALK